MKTRTRTKLITGIIAMILSVAIIFATCYTVGKPTVVNAASVRTVELSNDYFDDQSIFEEFDEHTLTTEDNVTYFEGVKTLDADILSEINFISDQNLKDLDKSQLLYKVTYDAETNRVIASATITKEDGSVEYDEISGLAFINEKGETDAYMDIDGETVLLSELNGAGVIENCGWLSRLIKRVATVFPVLAVVTAVVHVVQESFAITNWNYNKTLPKPVGYINNQRGRKNWKYGVGSNIADNGCGVIAIYNVMQKLGRHVDFADLIFDIDSKSGDLFYGIGGVDVSHFREYFCLKGIGFKGYYSYSSMKTALENMSLDQMAIVSFWVSSGCGHYIAVERVINDEGKSVFNFYNYESETKCNVKEQITPGCFKKGFINGFIIG